MFKAIFVDRDGVLVKDPGHVHKLEEFELYPDVINALRLVQDYKLVVLNSQPGIAKNIHTTDDSRKFNRHLTNVLASAGVELTAIYICPHHPAVSACDCRKPKPGLIFQAANEHNLDLKDCWMIGDKRSDVAAGKAAGCRTILVKTGFGGGGGDTELDVKPDFVAENLLEATMIIRSFNTTAVILCGGLGTRMGNLVRDKPKPMLEVCGKPILLWQVELLKKYGIRNFVFCTYYLHDVIENYFGDGSKFDVRINYAREQTPLGSGGAVKNALQFLGENFIVFAGDIIVNFNILEALEFHKKKGALATAILRLSEHPEDSDLLEIDFTNKIIKFYEKKTGGHLHTRLANTGLFILNKHLLYFLPDGHSNIEKDGVFKQIDSGRCFAYVPNKYYIKDIGTPDRLTQAGQDFEKWQV